MADDNSAKQKESRKQNDKNNPKCNRFSVKPTDKEWPIFGEFLKAERAPTVQEKIIKYEEFIKKYSTNSELKIEELVAMAMFNLGVVLYHDNRKTDAVDAWDALIRKKFKNADCSLICEEIAMAMFYKGSHYFTVSNRKEDAVKIYEEFIKLAESGNINIGPEFVIVALFDTWKYLVKTNEKTKIVEVCKKCFSFFSQCNPTFQLDTSFCVIMVMLDKGLAELDCRDEGLAAFMDLRYKANKIAKKYHINGKSNVAYYTKIKAIHSMLPETVQKMEIVDQDDKKNFGNPSACLRLYNIGYMNDPAEGRALINYSKIISDLQKDDNDRPILHEFFGELKLNESGLHAENLFCVSFAGFDDRLDLWRAYGNNGDGYSIVIPEKVFNEEPEDMFSKMVTPCEREVEVLKNNINIKEYKFILSTSAPRRTLFKVQYLQRRKDVFLERAEADEEKAKRLKILKGMNVKLSGEEKEACEFVIKEIEKKDAGLEVLNSLNESLKAIKKYETRLLDGEIAENKEKIKKDIDSIVQMILVEILYLFKDEEYSSEHEYRMIAYRSPSPEAGRKLEEQPREDGMRREYIETKPFLFDEEGYEIVIGPRVKDKYAAKQEIEYLLRANSKKAKVRRSDILYR